MIRLRFSLPILLLWCAPASAHDYWLQPATFFPTVGKPVSMSLHVGDHLISESERPYDKKATLRLQHVSARGSIDLAPAASEGNRPFVKITPGTAGIHVIALERDSRLIALEAKKFNRYLTDEGLDGIVADRLKRGETDRPGRERYWRSIKALLRAGGKGDDTWKKALGQKLEIVPLADPTELKAGAPLRVRVLFMRKPLSGATLFALHRDGGKTVSLRAATSAEGEASFKLEKSGPWLIRLVHMRRAADDAQADWESFWSALSFAIH